MSEDRGQGSTVSGSMTRYSDERKEEIGRTKDPCRK